MVETFNTGGTVAAFSAFLKTWFIREHYTQALEGYSGEVLLVGINYDKEDRNKRHSCVIERMTLRSGV